MGVSSHPRRTKNKGGRERGPCGIVKLFFVLIRSTRASSLLPSSVMAITWECISSLMDGP